MDIREELSQYIKLPGVGADEIRAAFALPPSPEMGDLSLPCFKFAKTMRMSPDKIAAVIAGIEYPPIIAEVKILSGYANFFYNRAGFAALALKETLPRPRIDKTVCIDYSSVNIAKPFHMGHLSTTAIGGSLYRIYKYLGYNVVGINHLGDFGTQFGKLIAAYLMWGDERGLEERKLKALNDLYVRFHKYSEEHPEALETARVFSKKIEDGDAEAVRLFNLFKELTLLDVNAIYDRMGVVFDSYNGESFFVKYVPDTVRELSDKNLLTLSEGAKVVDLSAYDMPPCLILRSDGASLYATRDLAAVSYRKREYNFDKCLYVVAYQQNLHFKQLFKVVELMGHEYYKDLVHVSYGMVSLEDGSMSTREGRVVFLADVLDAAARRAKEIMLEKNSELTDIDEVAETIGCGAVIFTALCNSKIKDIVFSLDKVLSFEGETGPYLQYTYARSCSVIEKARDITCDFAVDYTHLCDDDSFGLIKELYGFDEAVEAAARMYEPSIVSKKLIDIAKAFNKFYIANKILVSDRSVASARLMLVNRTRETLKTGLDLILMKAPAKM